MNGFNLGRVFRAMSRNVPLLMFAAFALPSPAWATPTITPQTVSTPMFDQVFTVNVVEAGFVSGGFPPREIIGVPSASGGEGLITVSKVGRLCLQVNIGATDQDFSITFQVAGIDGSQSIPGTIGFTQGDPQPWINPGFCGDIENAPPQPRDFDLATDQSTAVSVNVVTQAIPPDIDEYPAAVTVVNVTQPAEGEVQVNGQVITYVPSVAGTFSFNYSLNDGELSSEGAGTITVIVSPAGVPPVTADTAITGINAPVFIDVLDNDDALNQGIAAVASTQPGLGENLTSTSTRDGGTAEIVEGGTRGQQIRYTPPADFSGPDLFFYRADGGGAAAVTVNVGAGGPPNRLVPAGTDPGTEVVISLFGADESLTAEVILEPGPQFGSADITGAGREITYTPDPDISDQIDEFQVTVSDGNPDTANAVFTIRVTIGLADPSLEQLGMNPTQRAVGAAIDVVCPALNSSAESGTLPTESRPLLNRCSALVQQADAELSDNDPPPAGGVSDALQQIAGEELLASGTSAVTIANLQTSNIGSRIAALRGGSRGISLGGLALSIEGKQLPSAVMASALQESLGNGGGASGDEPSPWSRLGVFVNGSWNFGDKDETDLEAGFDFDTYGITAGLDYRFTDRMILGLAIGYSDASVDFDSDGGSLDSDALTFTAYGTYFAEKFYLDFSAGLGDVDFDATRALVFSDTQGGVNSLTQGSTNGDQTSLSLSTGYNFGSGAWTIGPYISVDYLKLDIDGFVETEPNVAVNCQTTESGLCGSGWALAYDDQDMESVIASGGLRVSRVVSSNWGVFIPHFRATFLNEFEDDARVVRARFALDPTGTAFEFRSDELDSSFYQFAGGFSFVMKAGFSGFVDYEVLAGYDNLTSSTLTAGLRYQRAFR